MKASLVPRYPLANSTCFPTFRPPPDFPAKRPPQKKHHVRALRRHSPNQYSAHTRFRRTLPTDTFRPTLPSGACGPPSRRTLSNAHFSGRQFFGVHFSSGHYPTHTVLADTFLPDTLLTNTFRLTWPCGHFHRDSSKRPLSAGYFPAPFFVWRILPSKHFQANASPQHTFCAHFAHTFLAGTFRRTFSARFPAVTFRHTLSDAHYLHTFPSDTFWLKFSGAHFSHTLLAATFRRSFSGGHFLPHPFSGGHFFTAHFSGGHFPAGTFLAGTFWRALFWRTLSAHFSGGHFFWRTLFSADTFRALL